MRPFKFSSTTDPALATQMEMANASAKFLAGGTNILDLMKEDVVRPDELIDINRLKFPQTNAIAEIPGMEAISISSLAKNTETANHNLIRKNFPLLTQAILSGASAQIRNMATNGGNLNQRTRCSYFYEVAMPCNKREPGTGCSAAGGINRMHAIFGASAACVAVHPSDMCVALATLDASVKVLGSSGSTRNIPFADYHRLPGTTPGIDNNLGRGELIVSIDIPKNNFAANSYYLKVRDRASYAFALVSVAAGIELTGNQIKTIRIAMGGVAHKPWRAMQAENFLTGKAANENNFREAAEIEMKNAQPLEHNKFKIELGKKAIVKALTRAMNGGKH